jgi:hypothetical protein
LSDRDELQAAEDELSNAYRLFDWSTDPRLIDEAIHRIRTAEMRLDFLTHPAAATAPDSVSPLPWLSGL